MSKKMAGNGLWESSRMMLPEHKEKLMIIRQDRNRITRIDLDEQTLEEYLRLLNESSETGCFIKISVSDPFSDYEVIGQVVSHEPDRIKLGHDGKKTWIQIRDITQIDYYN